MNHIEAYLRPETIDQALRLRERWGDEARFLGGGVDLALHTPPSVRALIDLSRLGLSSIRDAAEGLRIGATATLAEIAESRDVERLLDGGIVGVVKGVASPLLRNLATLGGALASRHPWSDIIPLLLVLDAVVIADQGEAHRVPLASFVERRAAWSGGLIADVSIPRVGAGSGLAFEKFARTGFDVAMLNCAAMAVRSADGRCMTIRVAVGGTPHLAKRVGRIEEALTGEVLDAAAIDAAARLAAESVPVGDDRRASSAYRRRLVEVGVRRVLGRLAGGPREGGR